MDKKNTHSLDDVARHAADGHYVVQSVPSVNPERDREISRAIARMKAQSDNHVKTHQ
ncbi:hypothetical protein GZH47_25870 [Paenibacillus rhizovicinus]|uniref:Uncharacterized protein n=1 Tax=Paenibacillus rhizovicinus TaxID=2704463 RepID=A0A6C0P8C1_9BACL|nr:hypothetical protein [Paenibacillus rhizovicinus]QHW33883.1 hypothetical protein GZH47_25870 [Paenibacillus rhizovicinus]